MKKIKYMLSEFPTMESAIYKQSDDLNRIHFQSQLV